MTILREQKKKSGPALKRVPRKVEDMYTIARWVPVVKDVVEVCGHGRGERWGGRREGRGRVKGGKGWNEGEGEGGKGWNEGEGEGGGVWSREGAVGG